MENFKQIPGFENYGISPAGEVKNLKTGKILKPQKSNKSKYFIVGLGKSQYIHILMAITYLNHTPNGHIIEVDHRNDNPLDNRLENLQLITQRQNTVKAMHRDLPTGVYKTPSNRYRSVICINSKYKSLGTFDTIEEASNAYQQKLQTI
jgi:hypothetical protein